MLELKNIDKYFGDNHVVQNFSLNVESGEFVSLLGPSGCGKTTLLRMVAGFEHPDGGDILLLGKRINQIPSHRRNLHTLFQNYALFPHMNVFDNVAYGLRMHFASKATIRNSVAEALEMVRLTGFENRFPAQMSGGQRQRVALARAVINRPPLLLLDEPLTALDQKLRAEMRFELRHLQQTLGITFVYVTHDQEEALVMSDRVVVMRAGNLEQVGTPSEIYFQPKSKFVSEFIGETNLFEAMVKEVSETTLNLSSESGESLAKGISFSAGELVHVSIRPDKIRWSETPVPGFMLCGIVQDQLFCGPVTKVLIELPNGENFKISRLSGTPLPPTGTQWYLYWNPEDAVVMHSVANKVRNTMENVDLGKWVENVKSA
jgi:spermidine/putrescine transport system ATP-binding protein